MNPQKHSAIDLFAEALRLTNPAERAAYLDRACAGDPALRQEVESLLNAYAQAGDFLRSTISILEPDPAYEHAGTRIGRYKLLEQIGEGGFGVVWMAEQEEPVRRRVALKIIKLGMDTKEVVARFEAERQALAMMEHPNIARVFDGGATDTGRPYFVMELVKGIPITSYCDAHKLATRERLELFMQVCHAVQHAHQKGIIHRDLKPSNILVTVRDDQPVPKVIDFGVAKATQARLTEKTVFTQFHQWIGTPSYMSPEQAGLGSLDVDTRSDVYSLGVLLYELLTGRTPFDTQKLLTKGYAAVMQTIREEEPPKPSTRLSTLAEEELDAVADRRAAEPARLNRLLRGDLDWIVMKALEKDRKRRYETPSAFARDLEAYLGQEPVSAAAPSTFYRARRFIARNRLTVGFSTMLALTLVIGIVISTWQAVRANQQARIARTNFEQAEQARQGADESRRQTEWNLYASRIMLAMQSLEKHDVTAADRALDACPPPLRHWEWNYLKRQCHGESLSFPLFTSKPAWGDEPADNVTALSFTPDGKRLCAASEGGVVLFDVATGQRIQTSAAKDFRLLDRPGFSADGRRFVAPAAQDSNQLLVVDTVAGTERLLPIPAFRSDQSSTALSADGRWLAVSLTNGIQLLALDGPDPARTVPAGPRSRVLGLSPDASLLVSAEEEVAAVWETRTGTELLSFETHHLTARQHFAFSSTGRQLAVVSSLAPSKNSAPAVELWDLQTRQKRWSARVQQIQSEEGEPSFGQVRFSAGDHFVVLLIARKWFAPGLPDILVLDAATGALVWALQADQGAPHKGRVFDIPGEFPTSLEVYGVLGHALSGNQRLLALGIADGSVLLLDPERGQLTMVGGHGTLVGLVAFSSDASRVASLSRDGEVKIWHIREPGTLKLREALDEHRLDLSRDGSVVMWNDGRSLTWVRDVDLGCMLEFQIPLQGVCRAMAPDGRYFCEGARMWDMRQAALVGRIGGEFNSVDQAGFSSDGRFLLTMGPRGARVWDARSLVQLGPAFPCDTAGAVPYPAVEPLEGCLSISLDGRCIATRVAKDEVAVYALDPSATSPREICRFAGTFPLRFGLDGTWLLAGRVGGGFRKVRVPSAAIERSYDMAGKEGELGGFEISPDGSLAACYADKLPLVELESGKTLIAEGPGIRAASAGIAMSFSPDGRRLAFPGSDGRIRLWSADTKAVIAVLPARGTMARFRADGKRLTVISPEGELSVLDGTPWPERLAPSPPLRVQRRTMPSETGVPGLKLAAFLQPKDDKDTWNNPIRHCAIRDPYVYALSRGGTLWTFLLPPNTNRAEASVIYPISAVQTEGNGNDMIVLGRTLLLTGSEACLEVLSLDKPEHPEPIAARGPQLSGHSGQLLLAGDHLFYFGGWYNAKTNQAGFIALFDVADPRQPRLIGMTNYPHGLVSGCIVSNRLVLQQHVGDWQRPPLRYSLAAFSMDAAWPLRLAGETPCDEWLPWLVPTGEEEILAVGDNSTRMLNWSNDGGPQFLPNPIPGGGRSAILSEHAGGRFLILQSSVLRRRDFGWEFHGEIPTMSQMDGSPYRAAAQGSFVAVPAGERVWLYSWSDASGTSILNK